MLRLPSPASLDSSTSRRNASRRLWWGLARMAGKEDKQSCYARGRCISRKMDNLETHTIQVVAVRSQIRTKGVLARTA